MGKKGHAVHAVRDSFRDLIAQEGAR